VDANDKRANELAEMIRQIQARVRAETPQGRAGAIDLPDLSGILHARDAAQGKVAAIGSVNPRPPGALNTAIQGVKRLIARSLNWLLRDQVDYNRALLRCVDELLEALNRTNRALAELAADKASPAIGELTAHWNAWRPDWERRMVEIEATHLRAVSELQAAYQHRLTVLETTWRDRSVLETAQLQALTAEQARQLEQQVERATRDFEENLRAHQITVDESLRRMSGEIQTRLSEDMAHLRDTYQTMIHHDLRLIRQRSGAVPAPVNSAKDSGGLAGIDWMHFSRKFRGPQEHVRAGLERYLPRFEGCHDVADLGCGRGEFLDLARQHGIGAVGVEGNPVMAAYCRERGHRVEEADLFEYLRGLPDAALDGVLCAHVIEHLPASELPELIGLCARKLKPGRWCVFETPNPECLAIFATHFYVDPTHVRPVPPALLAFYLEEAGFAPIDVVRLAPAEDAFPALEKLPPEFLRHFFGGLDYCVAARRER
jgi:O-antigen chain-terminating methyltransferase